MNVNKYGLPTSTLDSLLSIFKKHNGIEKVILYGSRALGTFKSGSDIDIVLVAPSLKLSELFKIENEIDDLLLPYKVDLSAYHAIENPDLVKHIDSKGIVLFKVGP